MGQHDRSYRAFFAHLRMVQDLLRDIVGERWVDLIDLDSGEQVNASFVSPRHEKRESDVIWKFLRKGGEEPVYVYILMEFQSRPDPTMAVRLMGYVSHFYQNLAANQGAAGRRHLPLVVPVVVYNGQERWNEATDLGSMLGPLDPSAEIYRPQLRYKLVDEASYPREVLAALRTPIAELFSIGKSRDWPEILEGVQRLRLAIDPGEDSLRRTFETWLLKVILPRRGLPGTSAEMPTLEEFETMLADTIDRLNRELREKSLQEGLEQGARDGEARVLLRQLQFKLGPVSSTVEERVRTAGSDQILAWSERVLTAESLDDVFGD
jgi:predicted transposase/invertase (TIGR01784 family)